MSTWFVNDTVKQRRFTYTFNLIGKRISWDIKTSRTTRGKPKSPLHQRVPNKNAFNRNWRMSTRIMVKRHDRLYDVTEFAIRHPGGRKLLEKHNGKDVEAAMQDPTLHMHSKSAYDMLAKYLVQGKDDKTTDTSTTGLSEGGNRKTVGDRLISGDFDGYVDWSQPLLGQVERLGDRYYEWTHQQVDRPIRLFQSDLAEMMTRAHWWMVPLVWCPVIVCLLSSSYSRLSTQTELWPSDNSLTRQYGPCSIPLLLALGVFFWTLLEYVIHRWMFHLKPPKYSRFLIRVHFALHGQHHKSPMDPMRLVFPPVPASGFAAAIYFLTRLVFPTAMSRAVFAGILVGYVAYDLTHYYVHHGGTPQIGYFRRLKTYHTLHHYKHQHLGFGISSKMWDYPFNTLISDEFNSQKAH